MSDKTAVSFISLGCAKNQINTEIMIAAVKNAGYDITGEPEKSKVCVINTCGFIEDAKKEALETFFEAAALKREKKIEKIIVCGCLAQRYEREIADELYEADGFVGVGSFQRIAEAVEKVLSGQRVMFFDDISNLQLEGERFVISPPFSTYLKIADGCSNRCSYCAIPLIRGPFRSRPMENILSEAKALAQSGTKELIVIAQDTSNYGIDIYGRRALPELLNELCKIDGIEWIRIMYLYPDKITDELIDVIKTQAKIVKYIEMPIQHASKNVLSAMNRPGDSDSLLSLVQTLRERIPGVILRTTVMVGFPGETDEDFEELCVFLKRARFDRLGVFAFSSETGTPAAEMQNEVQDDVKTARAETVELLQSQIVLEKSDALVGQTFEVICEGFDRFAECYFGRSYMEAPDIDGKIFFSSENIVCSGDIVRVRITECMDFELIGEIVQ
ncbi:MAG: 30S ribosomal protein S12 methylthiotransferase RimO [Clostridia bacterium]|nr:30S ribosomal protein S12 methylthiotransferase RimO [Clostridia bacterium]